MADYNYYVTKFGGTKIQSEDEFDLYSKKAVLYINSVTAKQNGGKDIDDAVCALCDLYSDTDCTQGIISESIDGVSVTYDKDKTDKQAYQILKLYLPSRMLYRGI